MKNSNEKLSTETRQAQAKAYPEPLRRIKFFDVTTDLRLVFLTNDFASPALTIVRLYKLRWQIELFFKWIKQHLRIKAFYGTSPNAVKTQIWIALSTYLLIAIIRKRLYLELPLYTILQVLSVSLFEKTPILRDLPPGTSPLSKLDLGPFEVHSMV